MSCNVWRHLVCYSRNSPASRERVFVHEGIPTQSRYNRLFWKVRNKSRGVRSGTRDNPAPAQRSSSTTSISTAHQRPPPLPPPPLPPPPCRLRPARPASSFAASLPPPLPPPPLPPPPLPPPLLPATFATPSGGPARASAVATVVVVVALLPHLMREQTQQRRREPWHVAHQSKRDGHLVKGDQRAALCPAASARPRAGVAL